MKLGSTLYVLCVVTGILNGIEARGDDAAIEGVGGAVHAMRRHPSVRMVSETVNIDLNTGGVVARFVLRNEGRATQVRIGFPEHGKDSRKQHPSQFKRFRSTVDGKVVKVRRIHGAGHDGEDEEYDDWWVKRVDFSPGQTRIIENSYTGGWFLSGYGCSGFNYILKSGASWKGPIGSATIRIKLGRYRGCRPMELWPDNWKRHDGVVEWKLSNFEPDEDVFIKWFDGFGDIFVNGRQAWRSSYSTDPVEVTWSDPLIPTPKRTAREVWAAARSIAKWLDAKLADTGNAGVCRIVRGNLWVEAKIGSNTLRMNKRTVRLGRKIREQRGYVVLPVSRIAYALDGAARWDSRSRLQITMKNFTRAKSE